MKLVYRHNRVTRFTHWIDAIALMVLFMSGLQIFNAFPQLYWGSKAELNQAFLSISAKEHDGDVRGYTEILGHRLDTTGVLGVQFTESGPFPRAFPSWITERSESEVVATPARRRSDAARSWRLA